MLGYHDSNRCIYDLWGPSAYHSCENADKHQFGYGVWEDTPYHCATDNRAFSPYAKHTQELEDIINMIGNGYSGGIECDDDMSNGDMHYIESEVYKRYGITCNLS